MAKRLNRYEKCKFLFEIRIFKWKFIHLKLSLFQNPWKMPGD